MRRTFSIHPQWIGGISSPHPWRDGCFRSGKSCASCQSPHPGGMCAKVVGRLNCWIVEWCPHQVARRLPSGPDSSECIEAQARPFPPLFFPFSFFLFHLALCRSTAGESWVVDWLNCWMVYSVLLRCGSVAGEKIKGVRVKGCMLKIMPTYEQFRWFTPVFYPP